MQYKKEPEGSFIMPAVFPGKFLHQMLNILETGAAHGACAGGRLHLLYGFCAGLHGLLDHSVCNGHAIAHGFVEIHCD